MESFAGGRDRLKPDDAVMDRFVKTQFSSYHLSVSIINIRPQQAWQELGKFPCII